MNKFTILKSLILILVVFVACTKKIAKPTPVVTTLPTTVPTTTTTTTPTTPTVSVCETITFTKDIKPIVDANCVNCHNENFSGANYKLYADLKEKALNGQLKKYTIDGNPIIMPKFGTKLPQDKLDLILCWINNGAKQ